MMITFDEFLFERSDFVTYDDMLRYWKKEEKEEIEERVKNGLMDKLRHRIPPKFSEYNKYIKSITDVSDEKKGIKFEIKLTTGDILHAFRTDVHYNNWYWYLNRKKIREEDIFNKLEPLLLTPYEIWKNNYDGLDDTYEYSDDHGAYMRGAQKRGKVNYLYNKLSPSDKKKADAYKSKK